MYSFVWAIDEDGKLSKCYARPENRGKGSCKHKFHAQEGETVRELFNHFGNQRTKSPKRKINCLGVLDTVKWSLDSEGLLLLEPTDNSEGSLVEPLMCERALRCYSDYIKKIEAEGKIFLPYDSEELFRGFPELTTIDLSNFDTSNVTDMRYMFKNCPKLTNINFSSFDTSNVIDMCSMFKDCSSLKTIDLSGFNTNNVENVRDMFYGCESLKSLDLSNFDTQSVEDMSKMFSGCLELTSLDLSNFDTSKVTDMSDMFGNCHKLASLDLSNFDTSKVTDTEYMFSGCSSLTTLDLSNFDTSNVDCMSGMFYGCDSLTDIDLSNFDTSKVVNMSEMFSYCSSLKTLDLSFVKSIKGVNSYKLLEGADSLSNLSLSSKIESRTNCLSLIPPLICYQRNDCLYSGQTQAHILLGFLEKQTGADYSKEKRLLKDIKNIYDIDGISVWKSEHRPDKKAEGIVKILKTHKITMDDLQTKDFKTLKEKGVMSDIDAYLSEVPLEDILA